MPIKIITPVNIIAKSIPNGLNQDSLGGVINPFPNTTDNKTVNMYVKKINWGLLLALIRPAKITNKNVPVNAKVDPLKNEVSM